jgi:chemotaxis protein MotA
MKSHATGLILGVAIIYYAVMNTGNDSRAYFDFMSLLIVLGGTICVSLINNGFKSTIKIASLFLKVFKNEKYNKVLITQELVSLSIKHYNGNLNLKNIQDENYHPFVTDGLRLLHNKFDKERLKSLMINQMVQYSEHNAKTVEVIETLAKYPPAFGMVGTIIGIVAVLGQISSPEKINTIGPAMAVALVTTLYGILISNYILFPIADNLTAKGETDTKVRELVAEAIILIAENNDPVFVREALLTYLSPEEKKQFLSIAQVTQIRGEQAA